MARQEGRYDRQQHQHGRAQPQRPADGAGGTEAVRGLSTGDVADHGADAEGEQHAGQRDLDEPGALDGERRDIGKDGEGAGERKQRGGEDRHHAGAKRGRQPCPERQPGADKAARQTPPQDRAGERAKPGNGEEGATPAGEGRDQGAQRRADGHRHGGAADDDGNRPSAVMVVDQRDRCALGRGGEQAGRQRHDDARDQKHFEGGTERRHEVAEHEEGQRPQDDAAPVPLACQRRQDRRSHRIGEREGGDQRTGERDRDAGIRRDVREQAGNDETLGRDGERAEREPEEALVHGGCP